jgi:hypothetical protein
MALWGNNDSVYSTGTVAVNLETKTVTGTVGVVTFTSAGIKTGDIITVGTGGTYGQAVITGFTSTTISIASTEAFIAISTIPSGSRYNINQQPIYTLFDSTFNNRNNVASSFANLGVTGTATTNAGIGTNIIPVIIGTKDVIVGDAIVNGGSNLIISTIGATTVSLASTISVGIDTGNTIEFRRITDGYFRDVFGVDQIEVGVARTTKYAVAHSGWVGIMTYIDTHGNLRVKSEVLVAGGISTTSDAADDARFPDS